MLRLIGVLLSCGALCITTPVPSTVQTGCNVSALIRETLNDTQIPDPKGSGEITFLNKMMEEGANATTYLEGFIEALKRREASLMERQIVQKLQKIRDDGKSCLGWTKQHWEPVKEEDFFRNLRRFLKFLNHYAFSEETA